MIEVKLGLYQHYKGNLYQVIGVGRHTETLEEYVVYQSLYGDYGLWVRPAHMFCETIFLENKQVARFTFIHALGQQAPAIR